MSSSLGRWFHSHLAGHLPTRANLERNRYIRPFAHRLLASELWRATRRSVPRGVALGVFIGITIPFAHSAIATLLAIFVRANVPATILATWISNPLTWPLLWPLAYRIGSLLLHLDRWTSGSPIANGVLGNAPLPEVATHHPMLHRLADAGLATAAGLTVEGAVLASLSYLLSFWGWRWWVLRRRRQRLQRVV